MCSNRKMHAGNPSFCHSFVEKNVLWTETAGIIKCMPDFPRFGSAFGCTGLLLTPVIQDSENNPGMEAR